MSAVDVEQFIDERRLGIFHVSLLFWSFLATLADGYDLTMLSFAAPAIAKTFHLAPGSMGTLLSASLFGVLVGAPLLGLAGDLVGRRRIVIASTILYGLTTFCMAFAGSVDQLLALRFLAGIGMGGVMPNLIALNFELTPRRSRATLMTLMFTGIALGGALPAIVSTTFQASLGWRILPQIGGAFPLIISLGLLLFLPESFKFLMRRPDRRKECEALGRRIDPDFDVARCNRPEAAAGVRQSFPIRALFLGRLAIATPLLWVCFAAVLLTNYLLISWMPTLFEAGGLSAGESAMMTGLYQLGGAVGGVIISVAIDRVGVKALSALFFLSVPVVIAAGLPFHGAPARAAVTALAGLSVLGVQFGSNAVAGLLYPTPCRSQGTGVAFGVGRFGSICGPLIGAALLAAGSPAGDVFKVAAAPMLLGAIAFAILIRVIPLDLPRR